THHNRHGELLDTVTFTWDGPDLIEQTNTAHTPRATTPSGASSTWTFTYHPVTSAPLAQHATHHTPTGATASNPSPHRPADWTQSQIDSEFHAIITDLAGAPTELINPDHGTLDGRSTTTLWGTTTWTGVTTALRFAGQQHDPETGLHYNRHRYYNPTTSTYTTPDPLGLTPNPTSATAYVHNPHTWTDPLGLESTCPNGTNNKGDTPDLDSLSKSGSRASGKSDLTVAGRNYQKHMNRPGSGLEKVPGRDLNTSGQNHLDDILTAPGTRVEPRLEEIFRVAQYILAQMDMAQSSTHLEVFNSSESLHK
ncbi:hypothetical protein GM1_096_00010, partial [Gordonia malaquae NBRC 108250]